MQVAVRTTPELAAFLDCYGRVAQLPDEASPFFTPVIRPLTIADWVTAPLLRSKSAKDSLPEPPLSHQMGTTLAVVVSCA